jgi:hypothetical protein
MLSKRVSFGNVQVQTTYSGSEYNRCPIDHVLYRLGYKRICHQEYKSIIHELDKFKLNEMSVHADSVGNLKLSF